MRVGIPAPALGSPPCALGRSPSPMSMPPVPKKEEKQGPKSKKKGQKKISTPPKLSALQELPTCLNYAILRWEMMGVFENWGYLILGSL